MVYPLVATIYVVLEIFVKSKFLGSILCCLANQVQGVLLLLLVALFVWFSLSTCNVCPQRDFVYVLAEEGVHHGVVRSILHNLHDFVLLTIHSQRAIFCWNRNVNQVPNFWLHLVYVLANHCGVVVDYSTTYSTHYLDCAISVLLN